MELVYSNATEWNKALITVGTRPLVNRTFSLATSVLIFLVPHKVMTTLVSGETASKNGDVEWRTTRPSFRA